MQGTPTSRKSGSNAPHRPSPFSAGPALLITYLPIAPATRASIAPAHWRWTCSGSGQLASVIGPGLRGNGLARFKALEAASVIAALAPRNRYHQSVIDSLA
jgi:hypothetical protein